MQTFIQETKVSNKICDDLIRYFRINKNRHVQGGVLKNGKLTIDKNQKESIDLYLNSSEKEVPAVKNYLVQLQKFLNQYCETYEELKYADSFNIEAVNIQHYPPNGGFKTYHCERAKLRVANRVLVFMTYLNTVENAGTHFKYQELTTECKKGSTLIWPPDFTHTHKGLVNQKEDKYIVTGWFTFVRNN